MEDTAITPSVEQFYSYDFDVAWNPHYEFKRLTLDKKFHTSFGWTTEKPFEKIEVIDFPIVDSIDDARIIYRNAYYLRFLVEKDDCIYVIMADNSNNITVSFATDEVLTIAEVEAIKDEFKLLFPVQTATDNRVPVKFWTNTQGGPQARSVKLEVPAWNEIGQNYSKSIVDDIDALMAKKEHSTADGQMILWYGPPGTGKTYALRALISEWRDWASFHYIVDPEQFFGANAGYLMEVIHNTVDSDKWKVLILEDCGEMLSMDAKSRMGTGFQRLLNVVDGLLGQGLKLMVFVTTNEKLDDLHPAVSRMGRCFAKIEFPALTAEEVEEWLANHGVEHADKAQSLSELYGQVGASSQIAAKKKKSFGFS